MQVKWCELGSIDANWIREVITWSSSAMTRRYCDANRSSNFWGGFQTTKASWMWCCFCKRLRRRCNKRKQKKTSKQANNRLSHNVKEDAMAALVRRRGNVVGYIYNDVQKNIGNHKEQLMTPKKKTRLD